MLYRVGGILPPLGFLSRAFLFFLTSILLFVSIWMANESEKKKVACSKRLSFAHFSGLFMAIFVLFVFLIEAEMFTHNGDSPRCLFNGCFYLLVWGVLYLVLQLRRDSDSCQDSGDWRVGVGFVWAAIAFAAVIVAIFVWRGRYNALKVTEVERNQTYTELAQRRNEDGSYTLMLDVSSDSSSILVYVKDGKTGNLKPLVCPVDKLEFRSDNAKYYSAQLVKCDVIELRDVPYNGRLESKQRKIGTRTYVKVGQYSQISSDHQRVVLDADYLSENAVFGPQPAETSGDWTAAVAP